MFLLNVGYQWKIANELNEVNGIVILPSGNTRVRLERGGLSDFRQILLDPQLYLMGLDADECTKTCARLSSFPWFQIDDVPPFDSENMKLKEWDAELRENVVDSWTQFPPEEPDQIYDSCSDALDFQLEVSCTHLILPSPLIENRENEAETLGNWIDVGLEVVEEMEVTQPLLATVAIDENILNEDAFLPNGFLDTVVDQVTTRHGLDGVYIVIIQSNNGHPFETNILTHKAYYYLTNAFSETYEIVITNFADVFGLVCYATGATGIATGQSYPLRRLSFSSYTDDSFGIALPHYYSHLSIAEPLTETDLGLITANRLLRRIQDDTRFSTRLMTELRGGGSAATISQWSESQNNIGYAQRHFLTKLIDVEEILSSTDIDERYDIIRDWLETADANQLLINRRIGEEEIRGKLAPAAQWIEIMDELEE